MGFPNRAGDHKDTDDILLAELRAAGIPTMYEDSNMSEPSESYKALVRDSSGEVKTSMIGSMYGWTFKRAWYYWVAEGPGIGIEEAELLHDSYGTQCRIAGHCGCPSPREWYRGFGVGLYHVDTPAGLAALAHTIRSIGECSKAIMEMRDASSKKLRGES